MTTTLPTSDYPDVCGAEEESLRLRESMSAYRMSAECPCAERNRSRDGRHAGCRDECRAMTRDLRPA